MLGVVYTSFIEMVEQQFSPDTADDLLDNPALKYDGVYTAVGSYDHNDMIRMVVHLSELTGIPVDDLVQAFGEYLFHQLAERYPAVLEARTGFLDFLEVIETSVHTQVRKLYPNAELPQFDTVRHDPNSLTMHYASRRPFVNLALGLIQGCSAYYKQPYEIDVERSTEGELNKASFHIRTTS
ncbi:MAG: hypothetical protein CMI01_09640 [Oceanospirillaceae bacterium]|jgi:hypothetical protein|uniref:heme NO-binding domain-containing protein n=1 Tax=Marinobacterium litorale TaxID=404770 RepID=UPI000427483A|nr:heme NO-binding domain-containing protein [Marinobacterium litorale]MBS98926.1 hypothetical protein [Oceanospirillaceae bacterium]